MKKYLLILLITTIINTVGFTQSREADSIAVRQTIGRFQQDFAKGDFSDMQDYMTPDVNWVNIVGMHWHNLQEVQFAHQAFIKTVLKSAIGKTKELNTTIRFITNDVAVAYVLTRIDDPNYPPGHPSKEGYTDDIATFVLVKKEGKWLIASGQNNTVVAAVAPSDPVLHMQK